MFISIKLKTKHKHPLKIEEIGVLDESKTFDSRTTVGILVLEINTHQAVPVRTIDDLSMNRS